MPIILTKYAILYIAGEKRNRQNQKTGLTARAGNPRKQGEQDGKHHYPPNGLLDLVSTKTE
jgi:hypothetical protein